MSDLTTKDIQGMLREKFDSDPWYYFEEVRDMCHPHSQRIDGLAINVFPSKFRLLALEVKVSRSDFMNEIQKPGKRAGFVAMSTQFYYVVPHGLVEPSEVPEECGLMYVQKNRIVRKKIAQQRKLEGIDPMFFASLIRTSGRRFRHPMIKFEGHELDLDDLSDEIEKRVKERLHGYNLRNDVRAELREEYEQRYARHVEMHDVIRRNCEALNLNGFEVNAENVERALQAVAEGHTPLPAIRQLTRDFENIERQLRRARQTLGIEANST